MFGIPSLIYIPDYISESEEANLTGQVEQGPWLEGQAMQRRVQHYGWVYSYTARRIDASMYLGPLPDWLSRMSHRLTIDKLVPDLPDQVIINEYLAGQGIGRHVDCQRCFSDSIACLSLLSEPPIILRRRNFNPLTLYLKPRSLLIMHDHARYLWSHEIPKAKTYKGPNGDRRQRGLRYSLTFRRAIVGS